MIKNFFNKYIQSILSDDEFLIVEDKYLEDDNLEYETKFCTSSGKLGMRASHFEGFSKTTLPALYMHRIFDKDRAFQRELVNLPNPNILKIYYKTEPISLNTCKISDYIRVLDIKNGIVAKKYISILKNGNKTLIESVHFANRNNPNNINLRIFITPLNYSGQLEFENIIDGTITNFIDFPRFRVKHYNVDEIGQINYGGIYINVSTKDSKIKSTILSKIKIKNNERVEFVNKSYGEYAIEFFDLEVLENNTYCIDKNIVVTNEYENKDTLNEAINILTLIDFDKEISEHIKKYELMWERANISIKGDSRLEKAIRFNLFHLMSTPNIYSNMSNIGAKMIHGEEYGGHAFWDTEIFILPFFIDVFPEIAKNLVEYRYNLLEGAKRNAKKYGFVGARYPWESADTGDEECPAYTIEPDGTCYECTVAKEEIHVTSDIIYGGYKYYLRTKDEEYFKKFKIMLEETSKYLVDRLEYVEKEDKYILTQITGPDEWHENVSNNFYTNYIVQWHLKLASKILKNKYYLVISNKIKLPELNGVIEQFDDYFKLFDKEIYEYDKNNMPVIPKEIKNMKRCDTTINKQADVVMSMFLFDEYFDRYIQQLNYDYYEKRTLHRSSLSPSIFCMMGLRLNDFKRAYDYFKRSAFVDYDNNQGNLREGMHAASAGGTWQSLVYGYLGLSIEDKKIILNPRLPENWEEVKVNIVHNKLLNKITVNKKGVNIEYEELKSL